MADDNWQSAYFAPPPDVPWWMTSLYDYGGRTKPQQLPSWMQQYPQRQLQDMQGQSDNPQGQNYNPQAVDEYSQQQPQSPADIWQQWLTAYQNRDKNPSAGQKAMQYGMQLLQPQFPGHSSRSPYGSLAGGSNFWAPGY